MDMLARLTTRRSDPFLRLIVSDWLEEQGRMREAFLLRSCSADLVILAGRVVRREELELIHESYLRAQSFWQTAGPQPIDLVADAQFLEVQAQGKEAIAALKDGDRERCLALLDRCCHPRNGLPTTAYWMQLRDHVAIFTDWNRLTAAQVAGWDCANLPTLPLMPNQSTVEELVKRYCR